MDAIVGKGSAGLGRSVMHRLCTRICARTGRAAYRRRGTSGWSRSGREAQFSFAFDVLDALGDQVVGDLALGGARSGSSRRQRRRHRRRRRAHRPRPAPRPGAILASAILVRRATNSSILALASAASRSASALAPAMIACGLASRLRCCLRWYSASSAAGLVLAGGAPRRARP